MRKVEEEIGHEVEVRFRHAEPPARVYIAITKWVSGSGRSLSGLPTGQVIIDDTIKLLKIAEREELEKPLRQWSILVVYLALMPRRCLLSPNMA